MSLLEVRDLSARFDTHRGVVRAIDGVSLHLEEGETLALVGESGSGKSVTALATIGLLPSPPGVVDAGEVLFEGRDLRRLRGGQLRSIRGRRIGMIFQDPMTSLNPLLTIERQLTEVLEVHEGISRMAARRRAATGLGEVGIPDPESRLEQFPHQLSGGMRQRVMIAMALLCRPALLIADEPTTALDVTIQAQILELLRGLQKQHGMALLLITHDLGVVAGTADRVMVMYAGRIVESGGVRPLFRCPGHPYTRGLLECVPTLAGDTSRPLPSIEGQPPNAAELPAGCAFAPRCSRATDRCRRERPLLEPTPGAGGESVHRTACFEAAEPVGKRLADEELAR
jgi:oligopeptide transport system ATP-binding protein